MFKHMEMTEHIYKGAVESYKTTAITDANCNDHIRTTREESALSKINPVNGCSGKLNTMGKNCPSGEFTLH